MRTFRKFSPLTILKKCYYFFGPFFTRPSIRFNGERFGKLKVVELAGDGKNQIKLEIVL